MGHFVPSKTATGLTLDFDAREEFQTGALCFPRQRRRVDAAFARIRVLAPGIGRSAAPTGEINHLHGGRALFRRSERSFDGNHHPPLRRPATSRFDRSAPATGCGASIEVAIALKEKMPFVASNGLTERATSKT